MNTTTGRCPKCLIHFTWRGKPLLRDALCPFDKTPLRRAAYLPAGLERRGVKLEMKPLVRKEVT